MPRVGKPSPVYHFQTSVKIHEDHQNKFLVEKKRSLLKWANKAGVSSGNLNYLWDHIIGDIVETNETSNSAIITEIKDLKLTVESLKATIDELVVSNKCITMKLMEKENNSTGMSDNINNINNNTNYDNDDYSPPQKVAKTKTSSKTKAKKKKMSEINFDEIGEELKNTNIMLDKLRDYSILYEKDKKPSKLSREFLKKDGFNGIAEETKEMFPIKNHQALQDIDKLLEQTDFANQVKKLLVAHKPFSAEHMLKKLRMFIGDDIAAAYTFTGTQSKMSFKKTLFSKTIYEAWADCFDHDVYKDILIRFFSITRDRRSKRMRDQGLNPNNIDISSVMII